MLNNGATSRHRPVDSSLFILHFPMAFREQLLHYHHDVCKPFLLSENDARCARKMAKITSGKLFFLDFLFFIYELQYFLTSKYLLSTY